VVGPRYNSPQSENSQAPWVAKPYLPAGQPSATAFDIKVQLVTPIGLKEVRSDSHAVKVQLAGEAEAGSKRASVSLQPGTGPANNRDFILDYRLAGDRIESGILLYPGPGNGENFFLAMVEPPKQVAAQTISPREYIFVVDISGSMHGFPLETSKALLRELIGSLRPSDSFNVLLFAGSNRFLSPKSVPASRANIEQAIATIVQMGGGGSTELIPALKRVYAEPKAADVSRTIVVVTDGYVTVEREAFELVRRNLSQANLFSFGIGSSVNRHLMEGLARAGMGEPFIITKASEAPAEAARFRKMIESPVLTSVKARFEGLDVYDVEPAQLPDVLGERPVVVFGKWRGQPGGQLVIEGQSASGPWRQALPVGNGSQDAAALRYLWARHRIAGLSDQEALEGGDAQRARITELGLKYNLLTPYTSFLAVDKVVRNTQPLDAPSVNQPSPMPQGVSNLAIGAEVPGTPEPAVWGGMAMMLSVLAMLARRQRRHNPARLTA
jgi:Ca-activated chloride channel family protein